MMPHIYKGKKKRMKNILKLEFLPKMVIFMYDVQ